MDTPASSSKDCNSVNIQEVIDDKRLEALKWKTIALEWKDEVDLLQSKLKAAEAEIKILTDKLREHQAIDEFELVTPPARQKTENRTLLWLEENKGVKELVKGLINLGGPLKDQKNNDLPKISNKSEVDLMMDKIKQDYVNKK